MIRMSGIKLNGLNAETVQLTATIKKNFEELGVWAH